MLLIGGGADDLIFLIHEHDLRSIAVLDLLRRHVPGQLVDDGADDLQVSQLLGAQRSIGNVPQRKFSSKFCVSWALGT